MGKSIKSCGRLGDGDCNDSLYNETAFHWQIGDILIYRNPANGQTIYNCPYCHHLGLKDRYGNPITHPVSKNLIVALEKDGILPVQERKYKNHLSEADDLFKYIIKNPGLSFYELDQGMGWGSDGRISERLINKQLKDKIDLRKSRKGHRGYKIYIRH